MTEPGAITPVDGDEIAAPAPPAARTRWRLFRPAVWALALVSTIVWFAVDMKTDWVTVAALVVIANIADMFAVRIKAGMRVSSAHFAAPFAVIATSVPGGIVAAAGCLLGRLLFNRRDWNNFDLAVNVTAASVAGLAWTTLGVLKADDTILGYVVVVSVFALFRTLVNYCWTLEARANGIAIPVVSAQIGRLMLACAVLFAPSVALYITALDQLFSSLILLGLPFAATQFMVRAFGRERDLNDSLERSNVSLTESLVNALDARDPYSAGHSVAVAVYARDLATELGLTPRRVERIYLAGLLHDIGKIAVPDAILRKPAALTDAEFDEIKKHPVVGEQILAPSEHFQDILPAVRNHHERVDGRGYPDGLAEAEIPHEARIIAVADAYNAMTNDRPYRDAMPPEVARRILVQNKGTQHDPFMVGAFLRVLDARSHDYAIAAGPEFHTSANIRELIDQSHLRLAS